jgi:hypothetical protein
MTQRHYRAALSICFRSMNWLHNRSPFRESNNVMSNWLDECPSRSLVGARPGPLSRPTLPNIRLGGLHIIEKTGQGVSNRPILDRARFFRGHGLATVNPDSHIEREPIKIGKMRDVLKNPASQARFGRDVFPL